MMKFFPYVILMILALACGRGYDHKKPQIRRSQDNLEVDSFALNQAYLQLVNDHRIALKLSPLTYHSIIEDVAHGHAKSMSLHSRPLGHLGLALRCRRLKNRIGKNHACTEVVAMGHSNLKSLFLALTKDPKQRLEIENPAHTHTGLGMARDSNGVIFWTQMFMEL